MAFFNKYKKFENKFTKNISLSSPIISSDSSRNKELNHKLFGLIPSPTKLAITGLSGYAFKQVLRNNSSLRFKAYATLQKVEKAVPLGMLQTLGLSESFSSYLPDELVFNVAQLKSEANEFTPLGSHFQRLFGNRFNLSEGDHTLIFKRPRLKSGMLDYSSRYLTLQSHPDISVKFAPRKSRIAASSFRYKNDLSKAPKFSYSGENNFVSELFSNLKTSQKLTRYPVETENPFVPVSASKKINIKKMGWLKSSKEYIAQKLTSIDRTLFTQGERLQKLLSEVGVGLPQGSYNRFFNVPFINKGGFINQLLLKRVLPAYIGLTTLKYADYLMHHAASNTAVNTLLKANLFRAQITDTIPGFRQLTDKYEEIVPGSQYAPLALPLAGGFLGGIAHYYKKATGQYNVFSNGTINHSETRIAEEFGGKLLPDFKSFLTKDITGIKNAFKATSLPAKGILAGLALMLPFVPGMIGSRKTKEELQNIYSGDEKIPVKTGRWWTSGKTPWEGGRITEWRQHWSVLYKAHAKEASLWGSEKEYWKNNPLLHPIKYLKNPYALEEKNYESRPYPITSPAFTNVPLVGSILAATIGKLIKPIKRMHEGEWSDTNYQIGPAYLQPRGFKSLPPEKAKEEFGLKTSWDRMRENFYELTGMSGFVEKTIENKLWGQQEKRPVYLQGSRNINNLSSSYYEKQLGEIPGPNSDVPGPFGYSEVLRRFIQREPKTVQVNNIPNSFKESSWIPQQFKTGDPFSSIPEGYARLPGTGYESSRPNLKGLNPEDYPDIDKLEILSDIAPFSREFERYKKKLYYEAEQNTTFSIRYEKAISQAEKSKESLVNSSTRIFTGESENISGTIESASKEEFSLKEYPGRTFKFSALSFSAADLSSMSLGKSNEEISKFVDETKIKASEFISQRLESGTKVNLTIPKYAVQNATQISAVVEANNRNINRELLDNHLAIYKKEEAGPETKEMYPSIQKTLGVYAETLSFTGDNRLLNLIPTPYHSKLWNEKTPIERYIDDEIVGPKYRSWANPVKDFIKPYFKGFVKRISDKIIPSKETLLNRNLDTITDQLQYLRSLIKESEGDDRYTNQEKGTATGINLGSPNDSLVRTIPSKDRKYYELFANETNNKKREQILELVAPETARALQANWVKTQARIAEAEGQEVPELFSEGRLITPDQLRKYRESNTKLEYGDWQRSTEISEMFSKAKLAIPQDSSSKLWSDNIDYEDVKLKIIQNEGYDYHDFNISEDRADLLWRKPYVEGAISELTSGTNYKSSEDLRQSIEELMIKAHFNKNPNVAVINQVAHKSSGNVTINSKTSDKKLLQDIKRNPDRYKE